ncbi:MAG TPA: hypothetical protein PKC38_06150, partial [Chitinophagales bacterium]|nr:hypothetical protein [Chitinophagales bacterium]
DRITDISNEIVERENDEKSAQAQKLKEQEEIERQAERKSKRVFIALMVFALCLFTSSIGSLFYPFKNPLYKLIAASSTMVVGLLTLMGRRRATWLLAVGYLGFLLVLIDLRVTGWILWPAYLILAYYVWETD